MFPEDYLLGQYRDHEERELQCPAFGFTWWADGSEVDGAWWPINEDDAYCGKCGVSGARRRIRAGRGIRALTTLPT
jgi:hypothetical protein